MLHPTHLPYANYNVTLKVLKAAFNQSDIGSKRTNVVVICMTPLNNNSPLLSLLKSVPPALPNACYIPGPAWQREAGDSP